MSNDMVYEDVPRLKRRVGDTVIAGANNATLLLGRDRYGSIDSGYGSRLSPGGGGDAGSAHLIVGRTDQDPSLMTDSASIYLTAKSDVDVATDTSDIGDNGIAVSAVVMRADCVRIVPRTDIKISVGSAYILIDSSGNVTIEGQISLGASAAERAMLGDAFQTFWSTILVPGSGAPLPPIPPTVFSSHVKLK